MPREDAPFVLQQRRPVGNRVAREAAVRVRVDAAEEGRVRVRLVEQPRRELGDQYALRRRRDAVLVRRLFREEPVLRGLEERAVAIPPEVLVHARRQRLDRRVRVGRQA